MSNVETQVKIELLGPSPECPTMYDIQTDNFRYVTQDDVDALIEAARVLGNIFRISDTHRGKVRRRFADGK